MKRTIDIDAIDLKAERENAQLTQQQLGLKIGLSQSQVGRIESNPTSATLMTIKAWLEACGNVLLADAIDVANEYREPIRTRDWAAARLAELDCAESVVQAEPMLAPARMAEMVAATVQVPAMGCFGPFDSGKSTFLNSILGFPLLPTGWQPVSSAIVYVNHTSRRPSELDQAVYLLDKSFDFTQRRTADEIKAHLLLAGGPEVLLTKARHTRAYKDSDASDSDEWGIGVGAAAQATAAPTRRTKKGAEPDVDNTIVHYAMVYVDHPVLELVEFIDTPGFGKNERDTTLALTAMKDSEIAVICHPPHGFCGLEYITIFNSVLKTLPTVADPARPHVLRNLLLPITHSGANLSNADLRGIRDSAASTLAEYCKRLKDGDPLARRAQELGLDLNREQALRERIIPYYVGASERSENLKDDLVMLLEGIYPTQRVKELDAFMKKLVATAVALTDKAKSRLSALSDGKNRAAQVLATVRKRRAELEQERKMGKMQLEIAIEAARVNVLTDWSNVVQNACNPNKAAEFIRKNFTDKDIAKTQAPSLYQSELERQIALSLKRHFASVVDRDNLLAKTYSTVADHVSSSQALSASKIGVIVNSSEQFRYKAATYGGAFVLGPALGTVVGSLLTGGGLVAASTMFPPVAIAIGVVAAGVALASWAREILKGWEAQMGSDMAKQFKKSNIQVEVQRSLETVMAGALHALEKKYGPFGGSIGLEKGSADKAEREMIEALEEEAGASQDAKISQAQGFLADAEVFSRRLAEVQQEVEARLR